MGLNKKKWMGVWDLGNFFFNVVRLFIGSMFYFCVKIMDVDKIKLLFI